MSLTGAARQKKYREKIRAREDVTALHVLLATPSLAALNALATAAGETQRQCLERLIAATATLPCDKPTPLQSDKPRHGGRPKVVDNPEIGRRVMEMARAGEASARIAETLTNEGLAISKRSVQTIRALQKAAAKSAG